MESKGTFQTQLLSAVATDETTSPAIEINDSLDLSLFIEWSAGTSAGNIVFEEAYEPNYAGAWSQISATAWSAVSSTDVIHNIGRWRSVRARVETAVAGGTVTVYLAGARRG
jgi:hypothetical protein|tara:strand:+ start:162 stop:497 length:336 start_codon:yes stop_codon:yes gene_type:complete